MTSKINPLPFVLLYLEKMEREKLQKFEISQERKELFDEIKDTFHSFGRATIWCKNKNLIKNSGHKL